MKKGISFDYRGFMMKFGIACMAVLVIVTRLATKVVTVSKDDYTAGGMSA